MEKYSPLRIEVSERLVSAAADFFYLLERGYGRRASLDLVTSRWGLSKLERAALYRSVFDSRTSMERASKMLARPPEVLAIDGFNVLSTIQSALVGDSLLLATDGFVRDLSASVRKVRVGPLLAVALNVLLSALSKANVREVIVVFDTQVSRSGEFARIARAALSSYLEGGDAVVSAKADTSLIALGRDYAVATSDSVLIDRVERVFDAGGYVCSAIAEERIINVKSLLEAEVGRIAALLTSRVRADDAQNGRESKGA